ncbi:MAG: ISAzo13 family transposase [Thermoplasmata archaeon]
MEVEELRQKLIPLLASLDERGRRLVLASEARALGWGGIELVHRATGFSRPALRRGMRELALPVPSVPSRIRRPGGGRKRTVTKDPTLRADLEALVAPAARGDPGSRLLWTCKSLRALSRELRSQGHSVSTWTVAGALVEAGYSLQGNRKTKEGSRHPDRNAQFEHINVTVIEHQRAGQPVISVDAKKKELVGNFKNGGREWRPEGMPERVRVHDFLLPKKGKAVPYGVYDLTRNSGWVSVGIDHDTASFAVNTIRRWWRKMGRTAYPNATSLLITADSGGSNSTRSRLWKLELQRWANRTGLTIRVCHFPPGTSKWNKIEHRLFSFITLNWRGRPLTSLATIVSLIGSTRTQTGLWVRAELDRGRYPKGRKISDGEMARVQLVPETFHGDWNYTIVPNRAT